MDATRSTSSRLIKQERKKLVKQTYLFVVAAIVLVVVFIFVVLPLFIRFVNAVLSTNPVADDEIVLLQPPVLSAPLDATKSATLNISGFDSPNHEVVIVLNGQEHKRVVTQQDGSFATDVSLTEGDNSLTSYSVDEDKNESKTGQTFSVLLDTEKPTLVISEPEDGATISSRDKLVTVAGTTDPQSRVFINDRSVFPNAEGVFSGKHSLVDGKNEIKIKAIDDAGNETGQMITVEYRP